MWAKEKEYDQLLLDKTYPWKIKCDDNTKGSELYYEQAITKRNMPIIRVTSKSDYDPLTTLRSFMDMKTRHLYDENIKTC